MSDETNEKTQTDETPAAIADGAAPEATDQADSHETIGEAMDKAEADTGGDDTGDETAGNESDGSDAGEAPAPKASVLDRLARALGQDDPTKMPEPAAQERAADPKASTSDVKLTAAQEETLKDLAEAMGDDNDPVVVKARERFLAEQREREPIVKQHQNTQREQAKQVYGTVAKFFTKKAAEGFADKYDVGDLAESVRTGKAHPMVAMAAQIKNTLDAAGDTCTLEDALDAAHSIYTRGSAKHKTDAAKLAKAGKQAGGVGLPPTRRTGNSGKTADPWAGSKRNLERLGIRD